MLRTCIHPRIGSSVRNGKQRQFTCDRFQRRRYTRPLRHVLATIRTRILCIRGGAEPDQSQFTGGVSTHMPCAADAPIPFYTVRIILNIFYALVCFFFPLTTTIRVRWVYRVRERGKMNTDRD